MAGNRVSTISKGRWLEIEGQLEVEREMAGNGGSTRSR